MQKDRYLLAILSALPAFEATARLGGFTKAAESLGMAQPSVSRFIANLEAHVGKPLFYRRPKEISLTEEGARLYEATALGLGHIRGVFEEISRKDADNAVTIGCTHGLAQMWVMPRLQALQALLPEREIRLTTGEQVADLDAGEADFALRFGDGLWSDGEAFPLFGEEVFPVAAPEFAEEHNLLDRRVGAGELPSLPLLHQDHGQFGWLYWSSWLSHYEVAYEIPQSTHFINNYALVLQAAMAGDGVALAWSNLAEPYLTNGWLVELGGLRARTEKGYYIVCAANSYFSEVAQQWIQASLS